MTIQPISLTSEQGIWDRIQSMNFGLILLVCVIACIGFASLYSAAGGNFDPWASRQMMRFVFALVVLVVAALIDVRWWYRLAWPYYAVCLVMLGAVEVMGRIGMGAQRWIDLGPISLQPSELMKIAVVLVLARCFHNAGYDDMRQIRFLIPPALAVLAPIFLVLLQPDLGTALMIGMSGAALFFLAGLSFKVFGAAIAAFVLFIPIGWHFMHEYQRQRVMTFLNPESDPLGAGYHIMQSKIALGSGGIEGKGFLQGTQSHLNFLPEKQTDFIFTLWAEEWGLLGGVLLLILFGMVFAYALLISLRCRNNFGKLLAMGIGVNYSLYVFINVAMVTGLIPWWGSHCP